MKKGSYFPLRTSRIFVFLHDLMWVPVCISFSYWLRFNLHLIPEPTRTGLVKLVLVAVVIHGLTFWLFGCYRGIWRFASIPDLIRLIKAVIAGGIGTTLVCFMIGRLEGIPRSVLVLYPILLVGILATARITYRVLKDHTLKLNGEQGTRTLLIGAGSAGDMLVRDAEHHGRFSPVAFVDDDPEKQGHEIRGIRVCGTTKDLPRLLEELDIQMVLVTMPSAPSTVLTRVVQICAEKRIKCRTLPSLAELADGRIEVARLRPVKVEDLLGRDPVELDQQLVTAFLAGKRVLVTGGGGSIGSELCRQISHHHPALLVVLDNCEYNLYSIDQELSSVVSPCIFTSILADITDASNMEHLFRRIKPQVVFHAAAYKHVPMIEHNVVAGVHSNVLGTKVVADAAVRHGVEKFVMISTDKTVNPSSVMGATKRVAELYCQTLNHENRTHFVTTRFGNVLGSAGSVVPLFERQIKSGGPVTVTHPDITRYFMTIPEAASLILQAGAVGDGGEIFVLDMGKPVRICDLAEQLIQLSGLQPGRDIQIVYTGLRPGEKMHEELFYEQEKLRETAHPKLLLTEPIPGNAGILHARLAELVQAVKAHNEKQVRDLLQSLVPEFNPQTVSHREPTSDTDVVLRLIRD